MDSELDPDHGRPHSAPMSFTVDTLTAADADDAIARPELNAALADFKLELLDRITALLWRLFGGIVAVAGLAVAAVRVLPAGVVAG